MEEERAKSYLLISGPGNVLLLLTYTQIKEESFSPKEPDIAYLNKIQRKLRLFVDGNPLAGFFALPFFILFFLEM